MVPKILLFKMWHNGNNALGNWWQQNINKNDFIPFLLPQNKTLKHNQSHFKWAFIMYAYIVSQEVLF